MNVFEKCKLLLEAEIDGNIGEYLKRFDKKTIDAFGTKLSQAYKLGTKFDGNDSFSDIKAHFDLFDPSDKKAYQEHKVTNIKTGREARKNELDKEKIPEEPKREDFDNSNDFMEARKIWNVKKSIILGRKLKKEKGKDGQDIDSEKYDEYGYPKEIKSNKVNQEKISKYVNDSSTVDITNSFKTKNPETIKKSSNDLINIAEKILAANKIFSLNDFKKDTRPSGSVYKNLLTSYELAKKEPLGFKELTDLKRSILKIKRIGTHTDTDTAIASISNKEIYGHPTGRTDADRNPITPLADSALGDLSTIKNLDMNVPSDVAKLKVKVSEIFKDMGLWKKGGPGGMPLNPESRMFIGGMKKPEDNSEEMADTETLYPKTKEEKDDFEEGLQTAKKMYNWYAKGFKDISNEEIKQSVLNIKNNGLITLLALKNKATAPDTKSGVVDRVSNELSNIKKDLANNKRPTVSSTIPTPKGERPSREEIMKKLRG